MHVLQFWRRLNLWPRLAIAVALGFLLLYAVFSLLALRAVNASTERILQERLVITQMAAREIDRLLERTFYELEKATEFAPFDPGAPVLAEEAHLLAHSYGRVGTISRGIYFLDARGRVVLSEPPGRLARGADVSDQPHIRRVLESRERSVSAPFPDPATGAPVVVLTIPILNPDGTLRSMLSGLLDVSSPEVLGPLRHARDLGHTGHAELVDDRGLIIASTDYGGFLQSGEHLHFYLRMLRDRATRVETVPYIPWHEVPAEREREHHVMAFAPLATAPWGLAVGGTDWETFAPVVRLRNALLVAGALSLAFLSILSLLGARLLVHPVRVLTAAAREMSAGNLEHPIRLGESGEIGVLSESLEVMRIQLKESLEKVRRWGEELEGKVQERTAELTSRNCQLAAVTAVATAANEARDMEGMLGRCLDAVLEHTGMESGAVRLLDEQAGLLTVASARGRYAGFPCQGTAVGLSECPCGLAATSGTALYLAPGVPRESLPSCRTPGARVLAVLPLRSRKGTLGVLYLSSRQGELLEEEERQALTAIGSQIAIAIENARLLDELRRVEAQREVDRAKAEFISAVSHELRTPLGFIKGYATTLLREDITVDSSTQREFLEIIDEETRHLQQLIDELLDASRLQAGRLPIERQGLALGEVVAAVVNKVRPAAEQGGHAVVVRQPQEEIHVLADRRRLEQVMHNLLENAAHYSDRNTPVEVMVTSDGRQALVSVADRGDGIPEPEQERVFEPFYRGENARRRGTWGTGLGLAICQGIVEAHGGQIWVESVPGRGSTITFTLPLVAEAGQGTAARTGRSGEVAS